MLTHKILRQVCIFIPVIFLGASVMRPPYKKIVSTVQKQITWDQRTLVRVSSGTEGYCSYPRIAQLSDGSLLGIYEADGGIVSVKSKDLGASWSSPEKVVERNAGINKTVPDILQLKNQTLLVFYNLRPSRSAIGKRFGIGVKRSVDHGQTWDSDQLIYEAGQEFKNGCWEPSAIQLPSGEIQLFFANEAAYVKSDEQDISMLRSSDNGITWTKEPEIVSFRKGSRDGMPVPVLLRNEKEIAFAIEDNGHHNFKPYIIRNTLTENWAHIADAKSSNRAYALAEKIADSIYAGAPYLRQLKSGETILSYQGTEGRTNKMQFADMKVVVGDNRAMNFSSKSRPFIIPQDKSSLWNSLAVLDDDAIVALTSTNAFGNKNEIWMVKGRLNPDASEAVSENILLADPTIFLDNGTYYLYGTGGEDGFMVYQSKDLKKWTGPVGRNNGYALTKGQSYGTKGFWAPQVFKRKGVYYMAYTANEQIAIATSDSPLGPFKQRVLKPLSGTGNQIDPFVYFDVNGTPYLYHVKLQQGNRIFVVKMKNDLSDITNEKATECISGTETWENTENTNWPVTEGPTVIRHNKLYYLIYSANDFRSKDYAVGYATSTSPTGPWKKQPGSPFISRLNIGLNGTGHGDLFKDKDGHYQYVMHVHHSNSKVSPRLTGLINVSFKKGQGADDTIVADSTTFKLLFKN